MIVEDNTVHCCKFKNLSLYIIVVYFVAAQVGMVIQSWEYGIVSITENESVISVMHILPRCSAVSSCMYQQWKVLTLFKHKHGARN